MCIVIDVNTFASVFNKDSKDYNEFRYVYRWIVCPDQKGKLVYGGSKYKDELKKMHKYQPLIVELDKKRKVCEIDKDKVDHWQYKIDNLPHHKNFNDSHIIAIIVSSCCKLICSKDLESFKFLSNKIFYPKNFILPKFYTGSRNRILLNNRNIADRCRLK